MKKINIYAEREKQMKKQSFRLYGRQKSGPINHAQHELMDQLLPNLDVDIQEIDKSSDAVLEIGFGNGSHMVALAQKSPKTLFIGCEPFLNGVVSVLEHIDSKEIRNIRIHNGDIRHLIPEMPNGLFSQIYLLYPDPWPKKRHWKRRLVTQEFLNTAHRLLKKDGALYIASDHDTYQNWIENCISSTYASALFDWSNQKTMTISWDGWQSTKYEEKALREGRTPRYYVLTKK